MARVMHFGPDGTMPRLGGLELLDDWQPGRNRVWVDLDGSDDPAERALMIERFGIDPLVVSDAQRERHPPKVEAFPGYLFMLLKGLDAHTQDIDYDTIQIALFVGQDFLVTRHGGESISTERVWSHTAEQPVSALTAPAALAVSLCRRIVDRYLKILLALEDRLETMETDMFTDPRDELLAELTGYKTQLKRLRRVFLYHDQIFRQLRDAPPHQIPATLHHHVVDVCDHQERASSLSHLYYELASDLMDGYISLASHRLNQIMKVLTVITAIFVPLGFLAGVYGMNFDNMPELHSDHGYYILLSVMLAVVIALLTLFKRKRWL